MQREIRFAIATTSLLFSLASCTALAQTTAPREAKSAEPTHDALETVAESRLLPIEDPFLVKPRINVVFSDSQKVSGERKQKLTLNPVIALSDHSSLQISVPWVDYHAGAPKTPNNGLGDGALQYFHRFDTSERTAHGLGAALTFDTGSRNLGSGGTVLGAAYAFEYKPDRENKFVAILGMNQSLGRTDAGEPSRELVLRLQGFHYFDGAYFGVEFRNIYDLWANEYQPYAAFTVGGQIWSGLQLWGSLRLPLNDAARNSGDRINYSIGVTAPF